MVCRDRGRRLFPLRSQARDDDDVKSLALQAVSSALGQKAKNSHGAYVVRFVLESGHPNCELMSTRPNRRERTDSEVAALNTSA